MADINPPYWTDPLQNIINVEWHPPVFHFSLSGGSDYQTITAPLVDLGPTSVFAGYVWVLPDGTPGFEGEPGAVQSPVYDKGPGEEAAEAIAAASNGMFPFGGQSFTTFGSWHIEVTSNGPAVSVSPNSGSQAAWQYRSSNQGGPGYSPMNRVLPLQGGPLRDADGNRIVLWTGNSPPFSPFNPEFVPIIDTLFYPMSGSTSFIGSPILVNAFPSFLDPGYPGAYVTGPFPLGDAYARLSAPELSDNGLGSPTDIGGGGVTVSSAPFKANGKTYKALGLIQDPITLQGTTGIWCKRIDPNE